jgi:hypothetical protein
MLNEVVVFVCDAQVKALAARTFLLTGGYTSDQILVQEQVSTFIYDARTHDGGADERKSGMWIVIGRK